MFVMDESNVLESGFLERMNTLLANGEVDLYTQHTHTPCTHAQLTHTHHAHNTLCDSHAMHTHNTLTHTHHAHMHTHTHR